MPAIGQVVYRERQLQRAGGSHPVTPEPGIKQQMPRCPRQVGIVGRHRRDRTGSQLPLPAGVPALQLQRQHIACGTGQAPARLQPRAATGITLVHPGIQAGPRQLRLQMVSERQPCFQLPALAPGTAHVAVGAASTAAAGHRQLIGGIGTEKRQAGPRLRAGLPAQPGFPLLAAGRTQVQRQAGGAIGTVGQLVESRGFQPAAGSQVPAPVGGGREADPGHRRTAVIGRAPAVIRVVGTDVAVGGMELHPAVAQPGLQLPARQRLPGQLRMPVQVPDRIELLAAQAATHPEPGAVEIFPAAAQLALAFAVDPDTPLPGRVRLAGQLPPEAAFGFAFLLAFVNPAAEHAVLRVGEQVVEGGVERLGGCRVVHGDEGAVAVTAEDLCEVEGGGVVEVGHEVERGGQAFVVEFVAQLDDFAGRAEGGGQEDGGIGRQLRAQGQGAEQRQLGEAAEAAGVDAVLLFELAAPVGLAAVLWVGGEVVAGVEVEAVGHGHGFQVRAGCQSRIQALWLPPKPRK